MALPLVTPPDIPADRLRALQTAFMAMTGDGAFVEEIGKMGQDLARFDGDALRTLIARMVHQSAMCEENWDPVMISS
jgi:hypothetical protein